MLSTGSSQPTKIGQHVELQTMEDYEAFHQAVCHDPESLAHLVKLTIHLSFDFFSTPYNEDKAAICLQILHGVSHQIYEVVFEISGRRLFTRYNYTISSPVGSRDVNAHLRKFLSGTLTSSQMAQTIFCLYATERSISQALLGIRGVKNVRFTGDGHLEAGFRDTLDQTLRLPLGSAIKEVRSAEIQSWASTPGLDEPGMYTSEGYKRTGSLKNWYGSAIIELTSASVNNLLKKGDVMTMYHIQPVNIRSQETTGWSAEDPEMLEEIKDLEVEVCFPI